MGHEQPLSCSSTHFLPLLRLEVQKEEEKLKWEELGGGKRKKKAKQKEETGKRWPGRSKGRSLKTQISFTVKEKRWTRSGWSVLLLAHFFPLSGVLPNNSFQRHLFGLPVRITLRRTILFLLFSHFHSQPFFLILHPRPFPQCTACSDSLVDLVDLIRNAFLFLGRCACSRWNYHTVDTSSMGLICFDFMACLSLEGAGDKKWQERKKKTRLNKEICLFVEVCTNNFLNKNLFLIFWCITHLHRSVITEV